MTKILKFFSPACAPCRALNNRLHLLGVRTVDVNIEEESSSVLLSTYRVTKVPTLVKLEEGKETRYMIGFSSNSELESFLAS